MNYNDFQFLLNFKFKESNNFLKSLRHEPQRYFTPPNTTFREIKYRKKGLQVLLIADYATITRTDIGWFEALIEELNAFPNFLFLTDKTTFPESQEKTFLKLFENGTPDYSLEMSFFDRKEEESVVKHLTVEKNIDLIVFNGSSSIKTLF